MSTFPRALLATLPLAIAACSHDPNFGDENVRPEQALVGAQTAYIQALEDQLAEMRAELDARKQNGRQ